jgi:RNA polymerase sigma factor (TIGR02999 family)
VIIDPPRHQALPSFFRPSVKPHGPLPGPDVTLDLALKLSDNRLECGGVADPSLAEVRTPIESDRESVSRILDVVGQGDALAARDLLPLIYEELRQLAARQLAREGNEHTLQATSLVHEAYLRLVSGGAERSWKNRAHFFSAAAEAMRRILIDRARDRKRLKRGGSRRREEFDLEMIMADDVPADDLIALDEAISNLAKQHAAAADLVKLRLYAGLTLTDAAASLSLPARSADRVWAFAKAWLFDALSSADSPKHS